MIVCDVGRVAHPDLRTVDTLARVRLASARLGFAFRLRGANGDLVDLLELCGLSDVLKLDDEEG